MGWVEVVVLGLCICGMFGSAGGVLRGVMCVVCANKVCSDVLRKGSGLLGVLI